MIAARLFAAVLTALAALGDVWAAPVSQWFEQANALYKQEHFDSAEACYRKIVDAGVSSGAVYYNLGNACFRQNKLGQAVLCYERALRLSPGDDDIEHNLRFARAGLVDRVPDPERTFVESALLAFHNMLPLRSQLWVLTTMLFMMSVLVSLALFASHNIRLWLVYATILAGVAFAALGASAGVKVYEDENVRRAVVLVSSVDALNGPNGDKVLFKAHEGATFQIRQELGEWCLVSLPNGVSGWVQANTLGRI